MAQAIEVDYGDIQALARFGHGRLKDACYLLVRVADREEACAWLRSAPVTTAVTMSTPSPTALQVALTSQGLAALGVPEEVVDQFSDEFRTGMAAEPSRSRRLVHARLSPGRPRSIRHATLPSGSWPAVRRWKASGSRSRSCSPTSSGPPS